MKKLLFIITALAFWGCEENPVSTESVEIDWIIIKNPQMIELNYEQVTTLEQPLGTGEWEYVSYSGIGYTFMSTSSVSNSNIIFDADVTLDNFNGILTFTYNSGNYSYDVSDSYNDELEEYLITANSGQDVSKIVCYDNMSYCHIIFQESFGYVMDLTSPFEVIDYR